jgi:hypothetical protein
VLDPLERRMRRLADSHRFEEAAGARERAATFARLVTRHRRLEALVLAGRLEVELTGGGGAIVDRGRLVTTWSSCESLPAVLLERSSPRLPIAASDIDEISCVAAWLEARAGSLRIRYVESGLAHPSRRLPRYEPSVRGGVVDVEAVA